MRDWLIPLLVCIFWVGVSVYLIQGCKSLCATGWETSSTVARSAYYGPEASGTIGVSGEIGEARCQEK